MSGYTQDILVSRSYVSYLIIFSNAQTSLLALGNLDNEKMLNQMLKFKMFHLKMFITDLSPTKLEEELIRWIKII